jgi:signal peptidase I
MSSSLSFAGSAIPNLVSTWIEHNGKVILVKGDKVEFKDKTSIKGETRITEQNGRIIHGEAFLTSGKEKIAGIIAQDNRSVYIVEEDGFMDLKIISKDKLEFVHCHVKDDESALVIGTWIRKKQNN